MWLSIHAGIKLIHVSKLAPWCVCYELYNIQWPVNFILSVSASTPVFFMSAEGYGNGWILSIINIDFLEKRKPDFMLLSDSIRIPKCRCIIIRVSCTYQVGNQKWPNIEVLRSAATKQWPKGECMILKSSCQIRRRLPFAKMRDNYSPGEMNIPSRRDIKSLWRDNISPRQDNS